MEKFELNDMKRGWFVGNFQPSVFSTNACEVAIKHYSKGEYEEKHFHKIATEITVIIKGKVRMGGIEYNEGEIIKIEPGVAVDFLALTDSTTAVVKVPGALDDKFVVIEK